MRKLTVSPRSAGGRADVFVAGRYPDFSRSSLEKLFEDERVRLNKRPIKGSHKVRAGDELLVDDKLLYVRPADIELPIIYEDDDVIVVDKPAGVLTHSKGALNLEPTVASFIAPKLKDKNLSGNRAGIVHRLDRPTSGVIICARTQPAMKWLQKQFAGRKAAKTYLAIVEGHPTPAEAMIDVPIGRDPKRPRRFKAGSAGKPAQTRYKTLKTFDKGRSGYSLVELTPLTGRTHQIRVHLAYIGHPVAGDTMYGRAKDGPMLLHAQRLAIRMPSGELKVFSAPAPDSFKEFTDL